MMTIIMKMLLCLLGALLLGFLFGYLIAKAFGKKKYQGEIQELTSQISSKDEKNILLHNEIKALKSESELQALELERVTQNSKTEELKITTMTEELKRLEDREEELLKTLQSKEIELSDTTAKFGAMRQTHDHLKKEYSDLKNGYLSLKEKFLNTQKINSDMESKLQKSQSENQTLMGRLLSKKQTHTLEKEIEIPDVDMKSPELKIDTPDIEVSELKVPKVDVEAPDLKIDTPDSNVKTETETTTKSGLFTTVTESIKQLKESISNVNTHKEIIAKDNLEVINGIGKSLEEELNELGIYSFKQIAEWTDEDVETISKHFSYPIDIKKHQWIEQAKELVAKNQL